MGKRAFKQHTANKSEVASMENLFYEKIMRREDEERKLLGEGN
jgi:hypothetical protein